MFTTKLRSIAFLAAVLCCFSSHASPTATRFAGDISPASGDAAGVFEGISAAKPEFVPAFTLSAQVAAEVRGQSSTVSERDSGGSSHLLATSALGLADGVDAALWNFILGVRAQQEGDYFGLVQSNVQSVALASQIPVSPVPLPASAWMLLLGLVAFLGTRRRHGTSRASSACSPEPG